MYVIWNNGSILYVPPRKIYTCIESTQPPGPSPIENITVISCSVYASVMNLHVQWSPPAIYNGELDFYELCLGRVPLLPNEGMPNHVDYDCTHSALNVTILILLHSLYS